MVEPRRVLLSVADTLIMAAAGVDDHPGYTGAFTRDTAPGAIPGGARVVKVQSEHGDTNPDGAMGTVLGSLRLVTLGFVYWIEWDAKPRHAVFTIGNKIARLS